MKAIETIDNILNNSKYLKLYPFKFCLVGENKVPFTWKNEPCHPNNKDDFVDIELLLNNDNINDYLGVGISIQASNISAIDFDHCFSKPFDIESIDERGKSLIELFKNHAYIEFSFSGTGIRILFNSKKINDYDYIYYTKNTFNHIEYYDPWGSNRYVTITGKTIFDYPIKIIDNDILMKFLNSYMKRKIKNTDNTNLDDEEDINILKNKLNFLILTNSKFQDYWFKKAPGKGYDESESDYYIIHFIYDNITHNRQLIITFFESSPYFKSKDYYHLNKWKRNNYCYLDKMLKFF